MATGKRALIVDDSRSARVILSRMLEQHGLAVDTAESAEQALEYLQQNRPDVIFMDHLMPGMDGFQAVQAIKGNPDTALIPLMMYTSQEGELYVSQARALGAIGVLPKTVRPVDVSRVLYQLRLLPDRRTQRSALFDPTATIPHLSSADLVEAPPAGAVPAADESAVVHFQGHHLIRPREVKAPIAQPRFAQSFLDARASAADRHSRKPVFAIGRWQLPRLHVERQQINRRRVDRLARLGRFLADAQHLAADVDGLPSLRVNDALGLVENGGQVLYVAHPITLQLLS